MTTPRHHSRLLVVDDEVEYCNLISEYFAEKYNVCVSYDGEEAIKKAHEFHPDCILLDIKMPNMNGLKALKSLKSHHPKTPIIVVSASGSLYIAEEAIKLGAFDYILKPVDLNELEDKINYSLLLNL